MNDTDAAAGCGFITFFFLLLSFAGWLTHVIVCLSVGKWGFLIAGALVFPIAVVHGWGIWFGWWG